MDYKLLNDGKTKISGLSLGTWAFSGAPVWGGCDRDAAIETGASTSLTRRRNTETARRSWCWARP